MKTFQRWLGILLVSIAAAGLMVACGDDAESCIEDGDCGTGNLCNFASETCAVECTNDTSACTAGEEVCVERGGSNPGAICVATGGGTTDPECTTDDECTGTDVCVAEVCVPENTGGCTTNEECPDDQVCVDEVCETPSAETHLYARILDVSDATDCETSKDPGADIFGVELVKAGGGTYYGTVINAELNGDKNEQTDTTIIDGNAPSLSGQCPEAFSGNVVALGCGGSLVVSFIDSADNSSVDIQTGDAITVLEWGTMCTNGTADDKWEVQVCDPAIGQDDLIGTGVEACNGTTIGSASGISTVSVSL